MLPNSEVLEEVEDEFHRVARAFLIILMVRGLASGEGWNDRLGQELPSPAQPVSDSASVLRKDGY